MSQYTTIIHKTSAIPDEKPNPNSELVNGEIAINTHDGKMFIRQDQNGTYSLKEVGQADSVENVLYVSKSGNDTTGDGKTLSSSFASIKKALETLGVLEAATPGSTARTTIFVKSGLYIEDNDTSGFTPAELEANPMGGMVIPPNVSIVGDNLRTTRVKGTDSSNDLFYVQNASYITNLTFEGMHVSTSKPRPPAAVSFPPIALQPGGVPQVISTSPYVENCTSFNRNATGMLIDGSLTRGLRSMVSDSFTQINAGGRGVHLINRGYAQLVSIFTVSCDHAVLCESGGQCSLTNSNASFGNFGLKATGASEILYPGALTSDSVVFDRDIEISTPTPPKYGDAFLVNDVDTQLIAKCGRDVELILDAVTRDLVLNTNFNSIYAGIAYKRKNALADAQMVQDTIDALTETKRLTGLIPEVAALSPQKLLIDARFDNVIGIIGNGATQTPVSLSDFTQPGSSHVNYTTPTLNFPNSLNRHPAYFYAASNLGGATSSDLGALPANRSFIQNEVNQYISQFPGLAGNYDVNKCKRDIGFIVDAICYDLMYGGNSATLDAAKSYFVGAVSELPSQVQKDATVSAYGYLADVVSDVIQKINTEGTSTTGQQVLDASILTASGGDTESADVALEAHNLVEIIKQMISDDDLEALPQLVLPAFPTAGDSGQAKSAVDENKRELRQATTDWVIINTGIEDNFYYSVEGVESSVDFVETDYNGYLPLTVESGDVDNNTDVIGNLQRKKKDATGQTVNVPGLTGHGLVQGQPVKYSCTGTPITGLTQGSVYFVSKVSDTEIKLSSIQRNFWETAPSEQIVVISNASMSGTHTLTPGFYYNKNKCERDVGLIIDAVRDDLVLGTNFNSVYTGISYQRQSAYTTVTNSDQRGPTLAAMLDVKNRISQLNSVSSSNVSYQRSRAAVDEIIHIFQDGTLSFSEPGDGVVDKLFLPDTLNAGGVRVLTKDELQEHRSDIADDLIAYINTTFPSLVYDQNKCKRDTKFIVDALSYDILYTTDSATTRVCESYWVTSFDAAGNPDVQSQLIDSNQNSQQTETISAYTQLRDVIIPNYVSNLSIESEIDVLMTHIINSVQLDTNIPTRTNFDTSGAGIQSEILTAANEIDLEKNEIAGSAGGNIDIYRVIPLENLRDNFTKGFTVDFRKRSLIAASSMTFEYVGTGTEIQGLTNIQTGAPDDLYNRPRTDDFPKTENEVIFDDVTNLGAVYFTSTDHKGDFRIGSEMRINRTDGTIEGDTFNRSLFSVMTPYILAIEGN